MPPFDGTPPTIPPTKRPLTAVIPTAGPIRADRIAAPAPAETESGAETKVGAETIIGHVDRAVTGPKEVEALSSPGEAIERAEPPSPVTATGGAGRAPPPEDRTAPSPTPTSMAPTSPNPALVVAETAPSPRPLDARVVTEPMLDTGLLHTGLLVPTPLAPTPPAPVLPATSSAGWFRRALRISAFALAGLVVAAVVLIAAQIAAYRWIDPPGSMPMLARTLTGEPYERHWVPLSAVSENLVRAVVVSEDAKFCRHHGVDWAELAAAIEEAEYGGTRGASTLSMQVAKNLFLWSSRSRLRKALELPLALALDAAWPKERVLEIYLNIAEWGPGIFGIEAAARHHFRKPARALTAREASLLATTLPSPLLRDPRRPDRRHARVAEVVRARMTAGRGAVHCLTGKVAPGRS